jgi:preprotein translocase subunit SecG
LDFSWNTIWLQEGIFTQYWYISILSLFNVALWFFFEHVLVHWTLVVFFFTNYSFREFSLQNGPQLFMSIVKLTIKKSTKNFLTRCLTLFIVCILIACCLLLYIWFRKFIRDQKKWSNCSLKITLIIND